jgi:hypothetical protein
MHRKAVSTSKISNRQPLKNSDGSINRPWQLENGKVRWQGLTEESLEISDAEFDLVVLPAIELLEPGRVMKNCSEDLLIRCVRGYTNNSPETKRFQAYVPSVGQHVASLAEALDRIITCRNNERIMANELLTRKLPMNDEFQRCSPQTISGMDKHGHYITCERISDIDFASVTGSFSLDDFLLHVSQRAEAFQLLQTKESLKRLQAGQSRVYKHVHIIDLSGVSMFQFLRLKSTLVPIFKHCAEQYPNTMWKIFAVNSPGLFSGIWNVIKTVIDPETAAKVNIMSISETFNGEQRFRDAGIEKDQLPPWLFVGACGKEINMKDVLANAMQEDVLNSDSPLRDCYYPPFNKKLADRLAADSKSLPVAQVKLVQDVRPRDRSRSRKRSMTNTAPSLPSQPSTANQNMIIVLLVLVLLLLLFIVGQSYFSPQKPICNCSCP